MEDITKNKESVVNREPKRTSKWLIVLIVVVASIFTILPIVGMIYAIFEFDNSVYTEFKKNETGETVIKKDILIYDSEGFYNEEEKSYYIQGYFENKSKNDIEFIYIEYLVYDENDVLLGTAYCSIDTLKADTKWKFKAVYSDFDSDEASKFELSKVEFY